LLVGFSGAAGSGKTTLAREVAKRLKERGYSVAVVEEIARKVFEEFREKYGVRSLNELRESGMYPAFQFAIFVEQLNAEDRARKEAEIVLCDRTVYDNLMYTLLWCDVRTIAMYCNQFVRNVGDRRYDVIFLCEWIDGDVDDGFRTPDIDYRETQEWLLKMLLPDYIYLPVMPMEERVEVAYRAVESLYEWKFRR